MGDAIRDTINEAAKAARDAAVGVIVARGLEVAGELATEIEQIVRALLKRGPGVTNAKRLDWVDEREPLHDVEDLGGTP